MARPRDRIRLTKKQRKKAKRRKPRKGIELKIITRKNKGRKGTYAYLRDLRTKKTGQYKLKPSLLMYPNYYRQLFQESQRLAKKGKRLHPGRYEKIYKAYLKGETTKKHRTWKKQYGLKTTKITKIAKLWKKRKRITKIENVPLEELQNNPLKYYKLLLTPLIHEKEAKKAIPLLAQPENAEKIKGMLSFNATIKGRTPRGNIKTLATTFEIGKKSIQAYAGTYLRHLPKGKKIEYTEERYESPRGKASSTIIKLKPKLQYDNAWLHQKGTITQITVRITAGD